jgi:hypothetical protein
MFINTGTIFNDLVGGNFNLFFLYDYLLYFFFFFFFFLNIELLIIVWML